MENVAVRTRRNIYHIVKLCERVLFFFFIKLRTGAYKKVDLHKK